MYPAKSNDAVSVTLSAPPAYPAFFEEGRPSQILHNLGKGALADDCDFDMGPYGMYPYLGDG